MRFNEKWTWTQTEKPQRVRVRVCGKDPATCAYDYTTTFRKSEELATYNGEFVVEIDAEAIAQMLIGRAAHSRSGKSAFMHGLVRAKRISQHEVRREVKQFPFPENTTPIEEETK